MASQKVTLSFVENKTSRRKTYKRRVKSLLKKCHELSVLCNIDVCLIVFDPYNETLITSPSSVSEVKTLISKFKSYSESGLYEQRHDQKTFLQQSLKKLKIKLMKVQQKNRDMEIENVVSDLLSGKPIEQVSHKDFDDLLSMIDSKMKCIQHQLKNLNVDIDNNNPPQNLNVNNIVDPSFLSN
ncbi:unnamed protein product [Amaranthus hypochondriacus]